MSKAYPSEICYDCGEQHGRRKVNPCASWSIGTCDICGDKVATTQPRDFGHLKPGWEDARKSTAD